MDLNGLIDGAREEYNQVDFQLAALEGQHERAETQFLQNREVLTTRKHQLEGKLACLVDLIQAENDEQALRSPAQQTIDLLTQPDYETHGAFKADANQELAALNGTQMNDKEPARDA